MPGIVLNDMYVSFIYCICVYTYMCTHTLSLHRKVYPLELPYKVGFIAPTLQIKQIGYKD